MTVIWIVCVAVALLLAVRYTAAGLLVHIAVDRSSDGLRQGQSGDIYALFRPEMRRGADWFLSARPEIWTARSFDGLLLSARYLEAENAVGTAILMHGYRGSSADDCALLFRFYHELGYHVLSPDQRGHGASEGQCITFGVNERRDVKTWLDAVNARNGVTFPVVLHGISMGAATVLMAAALPLTDNVIGIVADCGFTSPYEEFRYVLKSRFRLPERPILPPAIRMVRIRARFDPYVSALAAMQGNARIPVLFIHGEADTFVPPDMTLQNYAACAAEKELLLIPNAAHGQAVLLETERCFAAIRAFLLCHGTKTA